MRERTRDWLRKCLTIALGVLVMSVAYNMFLVPAKIAPGGVSGAATIVYYLTGLPIGAVSLAMNVPLFILGWRQEGRDFIVRTLLSTVLLSLALDTLKFPRITEDPMLSALFGGVILGLGLGLVFMSDATTGGTDLAAKMIQRRLHRRRAERTAADAEHDERLELAADLFSGLFDFGNDLVLIVGQIHPALHILAAAGLNRRVRLLHCGNFCVQLGARNAARAHIFSHHRIDIQTNAIAHI